MNYFVSNIDLETVATFFFIGAVFFSANSIISYFLWIITSRYIIILIRDLSINPASLVHAREVKRELEKREKNGLNDAFKALAIISLGVVITFALYALCDGVPRLYALLFTAIGYLLTHFLLDSALLSLPCDLVFAVIYALISVIVLPIKGVIYLARRKKLKSDKK